tara:strand:- start:864 stop:2306 length:1443 start_codon:yes stop_codon:yes gene_type:complete
MYEYDIPPKPMAPTAIDQDRWEHSALRRRIMEGKWENDLENELLRHIPADRRESWGPCDLSSNVLSNVCRQLSVLYSSSPGVTHESFDTAPLVGREGIITKAGLWPMMQRTQQMTLALREMIIRIDAPKNKGLQFRLVSPDYVYIEVDDDSPDIARYYQELRLRFNPHTGKGHWVADCIDIRDPNNPKMAMYEVGEDGSLLKDVSDIYLGTPLIGEDYPYRKRDGTPFLPIEIYHAERTGSLWNPYDASQLAYGSLTSAVLWSFFLHVIRDASWPQRYGVGITLNGLSGPEQNTIARRSSVTTDPSSILMFSNDQDMQGQAMIGQFQPACDPEKLLESISKYELRVSTAAGISGDILRQSGDPRSGYAISVSREGQREISKRFAPIFRASDESLIAKAAMMSNLFLGLPQMPESGYRVQYQPIPLSPEETKAQREDVIQKLDTGLISPVQAIQILNPDLDVDSAKLELLRIRKERAEFMI